MNQRIPNQYLPSEALFIAAEQFRDRKLWELLSGSELFAVQYGSELLYCCIMGQGGEHFALAVYPGKEGIASYIKLQNLTMHKSRQYDSAFAQNCISCSFEDRKMLTDRDFMAIKCSGRSYRGRSQWPQFLRYRPMRYPWQIDAEDEKVLLASLEAALFLGDRLRDTAYQNLSPGIEGLTIPLMIKAGAGYDIRTTTLPAFMEEHFSVPQLSNDLEIQRLKRAKVNCEKILQCAITCLPIAVADEKGGAPQAPLAFFLVEITYEEENGETYFLPNIIAADIGEDYESNVGKWLSLFCHYIVEHGKPAGVAVNEIRADHLISGICEQIGLEYRYLPDNPLEIDAIVLDMAKEFLPGKRG